MNNNNLELLEYLYEGVYVVDKERKIIFWNSGSEQITGYKAHEVINNHCFNNILKHVTEDGVQLCFNGCPLHHTLETGIINEANVYLHHKDGHRVPVSVKSLPIYDENENIVAAVEVFVDNRYRKDQHKENRKLKKMLTTDDLTGIPNRRYLEFSLANVIKETEEFNTSFGILFFDIDHFKVVNDTYGHVIGDEILKMVSKTLMSNIRHDDIIGRWGGEEFIGVFRLESVEELEKLAQKIRLLVSRSGYKLSSGETLNVTISIGGTLYQKGEPIKETIHRADEHMYESKNTGRNKVTIK